MPSSVRRERTRKRDTSKIQGPSWLARGRERESESFVEEASKGSSPFFFRVWLRIKKKRKKKKKRTEHWESVSWGRVATSSPFFRFNVPRIFRRITIYLLIHTPIHTHTIFSCSRTRIETDEHVHTLSNNSSFLMIHAYNIQAYIRALIYIYIYTNTLNPKLDLDSRPSQAGEKTMNLTRYPRDCPV